MMGARETAECIATLFAAYGQGGDGARIAVYCRALAGVDGALLRKAAAKVIREQRFMPTVAEILDAARSIIGTQGGALAGTWEEAWGEIERAMRSTPWGKAPEWSTPELAAAVRAIGWRTLHEAQARDMPTVRAQVRRFYEDACGRLADDARNRALLGLPGGSIFGIPERRAQIAGAHGADMPLSQAENGAQRAEIAGASDLSRGRKKSPRTRICAPGGHEGAKG